MDALLIDKDEYVLRFVGKQLYRFYKDDLKKLARLLKEYNSCQRMPGLPNMYEVTRESYPEDAPWPQPSEAHRVYINGNWILAEHPHLLTLARKDREWRPNAEGFPECHKEVRQLFSMNRLVPYPDRLTMDLEAWVLDVLKITERTDLNTWMRRRRYSMGDYFIPFYTREEW